MSFPFSTLSLMIQNVTLFYQLIVTFSRAGLGSSVPAVGAC